MKRVLQTNTTIEELPLKYLRVLNGSLRLTDKELELMAAILGRYLKYIQQGLKEPFLSKFVFSSEERKSLSDELGGISSQNLGNKLKQLSNKNLLTQTEYGYQLDHSLLPVPEVVFKFNIV